MRTNEVVIGLACVSLLSFTACNRSDTDENARRARDDMRRLADRAGEQFADSWLATKIQAQYFADDDVKARQVDVSARDGTVTLEGIVDTEHARDQAVSIARATDGVTRVDDRLTVGTLPARTAQGTTVPAGPDAVGTTGIEPRAGMPADDGSVTTSIQAKFFRDSALKSRHIDVATQSGIVTLRGAVANDNERAQARLLAWTTQGVRRVDDVLTVDPSIGQAPAPIAGQAAPAPETAPAPAPAAAASQDAPLEQRVRARLQSDSQIAQSSITVSARDGVVLLDGTVPNAAAKQRAIAAARETEGVVQIVDRISVGRAR